ncbi:MAG: histidine--tRNA ligase [Opitutales bacterium]
MFESLPGFREFLPDDCRRRNRVFATWRHAAEAFGFEEYDAPVLEPLELYIEKSGEEIVGQLFNFEDRGSRAVALRPEMTPTLARLVGARINSLRRPVKWFNIGEHYRYERMQKGRTRAFYQFNADILGEPGPGADAELIALLVDTLHRFGLTADQFQVRLSDRQLWLAFLGNRGFNEEQSREILGLVDKRERMDETAFLDQLAGKVGGDARLLAEGIDRLAGCRSLDALRQFLLTDAEGQPGEAAVRERLEAWTELTGTLAALGLDAYVRLDLGIVRGLAYYTGFVYEAFETGGRSRALAGGGRYDNLLEKITGKACAATGFAMGDVTLVDAIKERKTGFFRDMPAPVDVFTVIGGVEQRPLALKQVAALRSVGLRVDYSLRPAGFGKQFKQAEKRGARFALVLGEDEATAGRAMVKDLRSGEGKSVPLNDLVAFFETAISNKL